MTIRRPIEAVPLPCALAMLVAMTTLGWAQVIVVPGTASDSDLAALVAASPRALSLEAVGCEQLADPGWAAVAKLGEVAHVRMSRCPKLGAAAVAALRAAPIETLRIDHCPKIVDATLAQIGTLRTLRELDLRGQPIAGTTLARWTQLQALESLHLEGDKLRDVDLAPLAKLERLAALELVAPGIGEKGVVLLGKLPALRELQLRCGPVTATALAALNRIERLALLDGTALAPGASARIGSLTALLELRLAEIDADGLRGLELPPKLTALRLGRISGCPDDALAAVIERASGLAEISLAGGSPGPLVLAALGRHGGRRVAIERPPAELLLAPLADRTGTVVLREPQPSTNDIAAAPRDVEVTFRYVVRPGPEAPSRCRLRVALPRTLARRQVIHEIVCSRPPSRLYRKLDQDYAEFELERLEGPVTIEVSYHASVQPYDLSCARGRREPLGALSPEDRARYLAAEPLLEIADPELVRVAEATRALAPEAAVLALHRQVVARLRYTGYQRDEVGAAKAWANAGGDCSEYSAVFVALCRARGLPARIVSGVTIEAPRPEFVRHAWAEVWIDGLGWVPFDPTHADVAGDTEALTVAMRMERIAESFSTSDPELEGGSQWAFRYWGDPITVDWALLAIGRKPPWFWSAQLR